MPFVDCVDAREWDTHTYPQTGRAVFDAAVHTAVTDVLTGHKGVRYSLSCRQDTKTKDVLRRKECSWFNAVLATPQILRASLLASYFCLEFQNELPSAASTAEMSFPGCNQVQSV